MRTRVAVIPRAADRGRVEATAPSLAQSVNILIHKSNIHMTTGENSAFFKFVLLHFLYKFIFISFNRMIK